LPLRGRGSTDGTHKSLHHLRRFRKTVIEKPEEKEKPTPEILERLMKFEVYGEVMLEKKVGFRGTIGRVYLQCDWVGHHVKIIRMD